MKAETLRRLAQAGFPVPPFITLKRGQAADLSFSPAAFFAIRSSFGSEDRARRSWAGQFLICLNVPRREVGRAAERVWASAATPNPYGDGAGGQGGCVIVQEMAAADLSGVAFTANPLGPLNEMVVTVGRGLGEGVAAEILGIVLHLDTEKQRESFAYLVRIRSLALCSLGLAAWSTPICRGRII